MNRTDRCSSSEPRWNCSLEPRALEVVDVPLTVSSTQMGLSENRVYSQLYPFNRDNDH